MTRRVLSLQKTEHPIYLTYEGTIADSGERETVDCFVLLGGDYLTLELESTTGILPQAIMDGWITQLGSPIHEPITQGRGVVTEEPSGEMILTATWRFSPEDRERVRARIDDLLRR